MLAGGTHICRLTSDGTAYCWGGSWSGQLGNGDTSEVYAEPSLVSGDRTCAMIAAAGDHSCGLTTAGNAYCWGPSLSAAWATVQRRVFTRPPSWFLDSNPPLGRCAPRTRGTPSRRFCRYLLAILTVVPNPGTRFARRVQLFWKLCGADSQLVDVCGPAVG